MFFKRKQTFDPSNIESVLAACQKNDSLAQQALIRLYFGFVKSISLRYITNKQDADEIINDSFLKVFINLSHYDSTQPFKAWLRTIVVRTAIDYYRRNQKFQNEDDFEKVVLVDETPDVIDSISGDEILQLIQQLSPAYHLVFTLYVIDGYTHREIADMLGIKEGTSKSNLQDARRKLQLMLRSENPNIYYMYEFNKTKKMHEN
jgi:RNA polymerase sigma-70 factor, ECF subfamily